MRKLLLFTYSIATVLVFTFAVYNISSIAEYFGFDNSHVSSVKPDTYLFYVIFFLFSFINYKVSVLVFKQSLGLTFIASIITSLAIDFSVLFTGKELMPLRFPFATIFPFCGSLLGFYSHSLKRGFFWIVAFLFSVAMYFCLAFILPTIISQMQERQIAGITFNTISRNSTLIDTSGNKILFADLNVNRVVLVDFYFVNCPPCELKLKTLEILDKGVNDENFQIVLVCDGRISTYEDFKAHATKNKYDGFVFLYDNMKIKQTVTSLESYPFEIILNKNGEIVSKSVGFDDATKRKYLEKNLLLIKKVL